MGKVNTPSGTTRIRWAKALEAVCSSWDRQCAIGAQLRCASLVGISGVWHERQQDDCQARIDGMTAIASSVATRKEDLLPPIQEHLRAGRPWVDLLPYHYLTPFTGVFLERAHTMLLAFMLDPQKSGAFAKHFLQGILNESRFHAPEGPARRNVERVLASRGITPKKTETEVAIDSRRTSGMPDLTISLAAPNEGTFVIIENKVGAAEGPHQLQKYAHGKRIAQSLCRRCPDAGIQCDFQSNNVLLFIDFHGRTASCPLWISLSYRDVHSALTRALDSVPSELWSQGVVRRIVEDYRGTLEVMASLGPPPEPMNADEVRGLPLLVLETMASRCTKEGRTDEQ